MSHTVLFSQTSWPEPRMSSSGWSAAAMTGCLHARCIVLLHACSDWIHFREEKKCSDWIFVLSHKLILWLIKSSATCYHGGLTPLQDDIHPVIYKYTVYLSSVWWKWKIASHSFLYSPKRPLISLCFLMFCFLHKRIGDYSPIHGCTTVETIWLVPCDRVKFGLKTTHICMLLQEFLDLFSN